MQYQSLDKAAGVRAVENLSKVYQSSGKVFGEAIKNSLKPDEKGRFDKDSVRLITAIYQKKRPDLYKLKVLPKNVCGWKSFEEEQDLMQLPRYKAKEAKLLSRVEKRLDNIKEMKKGVERNARVLRSDLGNSIDIYLKKITIKSTAHGPKKPVYEAIKNVLERLRSAQIKLDAKFDELYKLSNNYTDDEKMVSKILQIKNEIKGLYQNEVKTVVSEDPLKNYFSVLKRNASEKEVKAITDIIILGFSELYDLGHRSNTHEISGKIQVYNKSYGTTDPYLNKLYKGLCGLSQSKDEYDKAYQYIEPVGDEYRDKISDELKLYERLKSIEKNRKDFLGSHKVQVLIKGTSIPSNRYDIIEDFLLKDITGSDISTIDPKIRSLFFYETEIDGGKSYALKSNKDIIAACKKFTRPDWDKTRVRKYYVQQALIKLKNTCVNPKDQSIISKLESYYLRCIRIDEKLEASKLRSTLYGLDTEGVSLSKEKFLFIKSALEDTSGYKTLSDDVKRWCIIIAHDRGIDYIKNLVKTGRLSGLKLSKFPSETEYDTLEKAFGYSLGTGSTPRSPKFISSGYRNTDKIYRMSEQLEGGIESRLEALGIPAYGGFILAYLSKRGNGQIKGVEEWIKDTALAKKEISGLFTDKEKRLPNVKIFLKYLDTKEPPKLHRYSLSILHTIRSYIIQRTRLNTAQKSADRRRKEDVMGFQETIEKAGKRIWKGIKRFDIPIILSSVLFVKNILFGKGPFAKSLKAAGGMACLWITLKKVAPGLLHKMKLHNPLQKGVNTPVISKHKEQGGSVMDILIQGDMATIPLPELHRSFKRRYLSTGIGSKTKEGFRSGDKMFTKDDFSEFGGWSRFRDSGEYFGKDKNLVCLRAYKLYELKLLQIAENHKGRISNYSAFTREDKIKFGMNYVEDNYVRNDMSKRGVSLKVLTYGDLMLAETSQKEINEALEADGRTIPEWVSDNIEVGLDNLKYAYNQFEPIVKKYGIDMIEFLKHEGWPYTKEMFADASYWAGYGSRRVWDGTKYLAVPMARILKEIALYGWKHTSEYAKVVRGYIESKAFEMRNNISIRDITKVNFLEGRFEYVKDTRWGNKLSSLAKGYNTQLSALKQHKEKIRVAKTALDNLEISNAKTKGRDYKTKKAALEKKISDSNKAIEQIFKTPNFYNKGDNELISMATTEMSSFYPDTDEYRYNNDERARKTSLDKSLEILTNSVKNDVEFKNQLKRNRTSFIRAFRLSEPVTDTQLIDEYIKRMAEPMMVRRITNDLPGSKSNYVTFYWVPYPQNPHVEYKLNNSPVASAAEMLEDIRFDASRHTFQQVLSMLESDFDTNNEGFTKLMRDIRNTLHENAPDYIDHVHRPTDRFDRMYGLVSEKDRKLLLDAATAAKKAKFDGRSMIDIKKYLMQEKLWDIIRQENEKNSNSSSYHPYKMIHCRYKDITKNPFYRIIPDFDKTKYTDTSSTKYSKYQYEDKGGIYKKEYVSYLQDLTRDSLINKANNLENLKQEYAKFVQTSAAYKECLRSTLHGLPAPKPGNRYLAEQELRNQLDTRVLAYRLEDPAKEATVRDWMEFMSKNPKTDPAKSHLKHYLELREAFDIYRERKTMPVIPGTRGRYKLPTLTGHPLYQGGGVRSLNNLSSKSKALVKLQIAQNRILYLREHGTLQKDVEVKALVTNFEKYLDDVGPGVGLNSSEIKQHKELLYKYIQGKPTKDMNSLMEYYKLLLLQKTNQNEIIFELRNYRSYNALGIYNTLVTKGYFNDKSEELSNSYKRKVLEYVKGKMDTVPAKVSNQARAEYQKYVYTVINETTLRMASFDNQGTFTTELNYNKYAKPGTSYPINESKIKHFENILTQSSYILDYNTWQFGQR